MSKSGLGLIKLRKPVLGLVLGLVILSKPGLGLIFGLVILSKPGLGLVSVSSTVVSSNSDPLLFGPVCSLYFSPREPEHGLVGRSLVSHKNGRYHKYVISYFFQTS